MRKLLFPLLLLTVIVAMPILFTPSSLAYPAHSGSTFRAGQLKSARVKKAYQLTWKTIRQNLAKLGVDSTSFRIFIRAFKQEQELEVWARSSSAQKYVLYDKFKICASSGTPGPKRCQGDGQVPEGFYHINVFNPASAYHLSLGVSYPNASDKAFACKPDPGGAIMIHGNCVTIGCIPLTDEVIREVYVMAVEAKDGGQQKIPVHIFPARMSTTNLAALKRTYTDAAVHKFWDNLLPGYQAFESKRIVPSVSVNAKGLYVLSE
jgi:murein L,D-transpeptidase YafK